MEYTKEEERILRAYLKKKGQTLEEINKIVESAKKRKGGIFTIQL